MDDAERQLDYFYEFLKTRYLEGRSMEDTIRDLAMDIFKGETELDWAAMSTLISFVLGYQGCFARE
jgi:hypothetical protein